VTRAYKVLGDGRSRFTGWEWPLPQGDAPGAWVHASPGPVALCANGIHACTVEQLPQWLGDELWIIELDGELLRTEAALVASRGRLVAPVGEWDAGRRRAFAQDCAQRARQGGDGGPVLAVIERMAAAGAAAPAGYWAAVLAGERVAARRDGPDYDAAFAGERARQAEWLAAELVAVS
jgi:hypothetical protein